MLLSVSGSGNAPRRGKVRHLVGCNAVIGGVVGCDVWAMLYSGCSEAECVMTLSAGGAIVLVSWFGYGVTEVVFDTGFDGGGSEREGSELMSYGSGSGGRCASFG